MSMAFPATIPIMPMPIFIIIPAPAIIITSIVFASFFPFPRPKKEISASWKAIFRAYLQKDRWVVGTRIFWSLLGWKSCSKSCRSVFVLFLPNFWEGLPSSQVHLYLSPKRVLKTKFKKNPLTYFVLLWRLRITSNWKIICDRNRLWSFNQPVQKIDSLHFEANWYLFLSNTFL